MSTPDPGEDLREEMSRYIRSQINFIPTDLNAHPADAPEGMTWYDAWQESFDELLQAHVNRLKDAGWDSRTHTQVALNTFAISPLNFEDVSSLLSVALDRMARQAIDGED